VEVRIDMKKPRASHQIKSPLWMVLGASFFLAGVGAFCADRALEEPRIGPNEVMIGVEEVGNLRTVGGTSGGMDSSALFDPVKLTGTDAPDFTLPDVWSGEPVQLKRILQAPLVVVFGSYDCPVFCAEAEKVERFYQTYKDQVRFLYVQVAGSGHFAGPLEAVRGNSALAAGERLDRARAVLGVLNFTMPSVLDKEDLSVQIAYAAQPKRMVLIEPNGTIAADSGRGMPNGWNLAKFEAELKARLSSEPLVP